jgi:hypothetical protein
MYRKGFVDEKPMTKMLVDGVLPSTSCHTLHIGSWGRLKKT